MAGQGTAGLGEARHGWARQGNYESTGREQVQYFLGAAGLGMARRGWARHGKAWQGNSESTGREQVQHFHGPARQGAARRGPARQGNYESRGRLTATIYFTHVDNLTA